MRGWLVVQGEERGEKRGERREGYMREATIVEATIGDICMYACMYVPFK